jgi:GAF domain-containing protein
MVKWQRPRFDEFEVMQMVDSGTERADADSGLNSTSLSLKEFVAHTNPDHWVCTPLFTRDHSLLGILSFVRSRSARGFSDSEQCIIRQVANHMCVAIANAIRYTSLRKENDIAEKVFQSTGLAVIVTGADGTPLHTNRGFSNLLATEDLSAVICELKASILYLSNHSEASITKTIALLYRREYKRYKVTTVKIQENEREPFASSTFVSIFSKEGGIIDFSYLADIINPVKLKC